jgi:hypothetical protein
MKATNSTACTYIEKPLRCASVRQSLPNQAGKTIRVRSEEY